MQATAAQFQPPAGDLVRQIFINKNKKKTRPTRVRKRVQQRRQVHLKGLVQLKNRTRKE